MQLSVREPRPPSSRFSVYMCQYVCLLFILSPPQLDQDLKLCKEWHTSNIHVYIFKDINVHALHSYRCVSTFICFVFLYFILLGKWLGACTPHMHMVVKGHPSGVSFFLLLWGFKELNSGPQAFQRKYLSPKANSVDWVCAFVQVKYSDPTICMKWWK